MATRTTEATNTLETFRVNFNGLVDDIGNVTVTNAGDQLNTSAATVIGAINEIFAGIPVHHSPRYNFAMNNLSSMRW